MHTDWYAKQLEYETNILATFLQATPSQIVEGKRWYPQAIENLAGIGKQYAVASKAKLAAVCAVLSPRISWQSNLEGVRRIYKAIASGSSICPTVAGVSRNVSKAWEIANGASVELVSGPKVSSFYANLSGDFSRVTIDVWAARAAGVPLEEMSHLDRSRYASLERAYQAVAKELSFEPAELQAICWIVTRGKGD